MAKQETKRPERPPVQASPGDPPVPEIRGTAGQGRTVTRTVFDSDLARDNLSNDSTAADAQDA